MLIGYILLKRHLVVFLTLLLVVAGIRAYTQLGLEAYPDVANMQVRVITQVPGKAAEEVERLVTVRKRSKRHSQQSFAAIDFDLRPVCDYYCF
jgi:Cu/Ag efflux pump CusA